MEWPSTADSPRSSPVQPVPVINEMMSSGFGEVCARASSCGLPPCPFISPTFRRHLCLITVLACALGSRRNPRCLRAHKPRIENPLVLPVHEVATTTYRRGGSCSVTTALLSSAARSRRAHCWLLSVLQTPSLQNLGTSADADGSASSTSALRFRGTPSRLYPRLGHVGSWNTSYLSGFRYAAALCARVGV